MQNKSTVQLPYPEAPVFEVGTCGANCTGIEEKMRAFVNLQSKTLHATVRACAADIALAAETAAMCMIWPQGHDNRDRYNFRTLADMLTFLDAPTADTVVALNVHKTRVGRIRLAAVQHWNTKVTKKKANVLFRANHFKEEHPHLVASIQLVREDPINDAYAHMTQLRPVQRHQQQMLRLSRDDIIQYFQEYGHHDIADALVICANSLDKIKLQ